MLVQLTEKQCYLEDGKVTYTTDTEGNVELKNINLNISKTTLSIQFLTFINQQLMMKS